MDLSSTARISLYTAGIVGTMDLILSFIPHRQIPHPVKAAIVAASGSLSVYLVSETDKIAKKQLIGGLITSAVVAGLSAELLDRTAVRHTPFFKAAGVGIVTGLVLYGQLSLMEPPKALPKAPPSAQKNVYATGGMVVDKFGNTYEHVETGN